MATGPFDRHGFRFNCSTQILVPSFTESNNNDITKSQRTAYVSRIQMTEEAYSCARYFVLYSRLEIRS